MYDLPAIFGQIQRVTGRKIFYIGISQGATAYYVLMSKRTELNSNVTLMVSLAPIAYTRKFFSPFVRLLAHLEPLWTVSIKGPTDLVFFCMCMSPHLRRTVLIRDGQVKKMDIFRNINIFAKSLKVSQSISKTP